MCGPWVILTITLVFFSSFCLCVLRDCGTSLAPLYKPGLGSGSSLSVLRSLAYPRGWMPAFTSSIGLPHQVHHRRWILHPYPIGVLAYLALAYAVTRHRWPDQRQFSKVKSTVRNFVLLHWYMTCDTFHCCHIHLQKLPNQVHSTI